MTNSITINETQELLNKLIQLVEEHYVFPDVAKKMGEVIREKQANNLL